MKEFAPHGSKFFPFRADPFSEGASCAGKQTVSHKSCLPCIKWLNIYHVYSVFLNSTFCIHDADPYWEPEASVLDIIWFVSNIDTEWRFYFKSASCIDLVYPSEYCSTPLRKHAYSNIYKISPKKKNWKITDKKLWYFSYFCLKHRLWVLVRTASPRRF